MNITSLTGLRNKRVFKGCDMIRVSERRKFIYHLGSKQHMNPEFVGYLAGAIVAVALTPQVVK
jgi:hypothetical protein